ncbi:hypothetical protein RPW65_16790 [Pseudomonas sp. NyZ704]|nr:hypothetical protein RPW65_16790 [Pseudomonas sp. NyZ704]
MQNQNPENKLPADPHNPGWVLGWIVLKPDLVFVDIFASEDKAQACAVGLGSDYTVRYGSHKPGTDEFVYHDRV